MNPPKRLMVSRDVALVAWRYSSRSRGPTTTHDVALLIGEKGRPFWDCTCEQATLGGEQCAHILDAKKRWSAEVAEERRAAREARP